jgi:hypothetical protein
MRKTALEFDIDDRVVITDSGECFTGYSQMFHELGFKNCGSNPGFEEGTLATIFNIIEHPHSDCWLIALVDDEGHECLSSNLGVVLVGESAADNTQINSIIARLAKIESQLDQLAKHINQPDEHKTAVEWLIEELTGFDYGDTEDYYDIYLSMDKFTEIKATALEMEKQQNCK